MECFFFPIDHSPKLNDSKPPLGRLAFLILKPHAKRIVLLDSKEQVLDARFLLINERIKTGQFLDLKIFSVLVGERIVSDSIDQGIKMIHPTTALDKSQLLKELPSESREKVQDSFALDFNKGKKFASTCMEKFGHHVCHQPYSRRNPFFLVISFGRAIFRLDINTVAMCLQASFGGIAFLFKVQHLRDRSFKFSVASSVVGFDIYNLGKFSDKNFEFFINLWGHGGPNWQFEEKQYYKEQEADWHLVQNKNNNARISVFNKLSTVDHSVNNATNAISSDSFQKEMNTVVLNSFDDANQASNAVLKPSYAQVLSSNHSNNLQKSWQQRHARHSSTANLAGFVSAFKFPSFPPVIWPDKSYLNWFKAHGPAPEITPVTTFGELLLPLLTKK
jgi:hypothetical protein